MLAADFSHWLKEKRVRLREAGAAHASRYLRYRYRRRRPTRGDRPALDHLSAFLRQNGLLQEEKVLASPSTPAERTAQSYELYLRKDRALAHATIRNYVPFVVGFLKHRFDAGPVKLSSLRAADVVRFVQSRARHLHSTQAKHMTTALRSFLRYARLHGGLKLDLIVAVPKVAGWSMAGIPRAIAPEQTQRLLTSIDRKTAVGRRDYAILLLLARLGLRACEVASMELEDIDWSAGRLDVRGKGGHRIQLPMPVEVGRAIAAYLRQGRQQCSSRRVFLRTKAPFRGFQRSCGIGSIVSRHVKHAGISAPTYGSHQFRHGLASDMLRQGASLAEIGAVLGHRDPDTTRIYTKIDLQALRALAQPWLGGRR
jgi:site-specific recombinase XerD